MMSTCALCIYVHGGHLRKGFKPNPLRHSHKAIGEVKPSDSCFVKGTAKEQWADTCNLSGFRHVPDNQAVLLTDGENFSTLVCDTHTQWPMAVLALGAAEQSDLTKLIITNKHTHKQTHTSRFTTTNQPTHHPPPHTHTPTQRQVTKWPSTHTHKKSYIY